MLGGLAFRDMHDTARAGRLWAKRTLSNMQPWFFFVKWADAFVIPDPLGLNYINTRVGKGLLR